MNETGTKMTTRLNVVAMTARPISAVAARAASKEFMAFSSTKRKIFSSTTMASSMTMPTINTRASIVTLFRVKPSAHIMPNVEITEAGMATALITVERQLRMKANTTKVREDAAEDQMHVDFVQRGVDVARLVADDFEFSHRPAAAE